LPGREDPPYACDGDDRARFRFSDLEARRDEPLRAEANA